MTVAKLMNFANITPANAEQAMDTTCSTHGVFQSFLPEGISMETVQSVVHAQEKMTEYMVNLTMACNAVLPEDKQYTTSYMSPMTHPAGTSFDVSGMLDGDTVLVANIVAINLAKYTTVISD